MKYMGSKARIAKHILPIILSDRCDSQLYVEPFVGGGNMISNVNGWRLGADCNYYAIEALKLIRDGEVPKNNNEFTEIDYVKCVEAVKNEADFGFSDGLIGYALFAFSFGAKFCGGWSRGINDEGEHRDCVAEQYRAAKKQKEKLQDVNLVTSRFQDLEIPKDSIVYCDPPYERTTKYKDDFNHGEFWDWCRSLASDGINVFISEYSAPDDFECVWSGELSVNFQGEKSKRNVEKLFVHNSQIKK